MRRLLTVNSGPAVTVALDATYELSPQVALRSEPFGALAYHYGNRRLVFVRRPELVALLEALHHHPSLAGALTASGIVERRWPSFVKALSDLESSEIIRAREA